MIIPKSKVALVIVDTIDKDKARKVIKHCTDIFSFTRVYYFNDDPSGPDEYRISKIESIKDYNLFITNLLCMRIHSDIEFVMIVQTDGYIINPSAWDDDFLKYDYIGSPWGFYPYYEIPPCKPSTIFSNIGNGGFSLRSVKMLDITRSHSKTFSYDGNIPEDIFIAREVRPVAEKLGLQFPPIHLAYKFSCEDRYYQEEFGFHGKNTLKLNPKLCIFTSHE